MLTSVAIIGALAPLAPHRAGPAAANHPFGDPLGLDAWHPPPRAASASTPLPFLAGAVVASLPAAAVQAAMPDYKTTDLDMLTQIDPRTFQPVCPASDGFYRFGQNLVVTTVGKESYKEYAPLIAGGLLRVRLELCVVESFFYEAIIPFIKENGLSWILPLHETVETFLAGTIFAVASNFILIGSTKIVTVIFTYADIFFGLPLRIVGGAGWKTLEDNVLGEKAKNSPPEQRPYVPASACRLPFPTECHTQSIAFAHRSLSCSLLLRGRRWWKGPKPRENVDIDEVWNVNSATPVQKGVTIGWGVLFGAGLACKSVRQVVEALDVFVGRYLLLSTVAYVGIKFVHFKLFDPFP